MNANIPARQRSEHPKVSVIVPVYKVEKYLTQCLNSVVNQTMEELEIIVIDDGNKDRCRDIIDYFEAHDPRVVAIHQENRGYGAACNRGLDAARGEYLAIVESDDWVEPEMYEEMYAYARALDADIVKTPFTIVRDGKKRDYQDREYITNSCPEKLCFSVKQYPILMGIHASIWSCLYKTEYMKGHKIRFVEAKGGGYVDVGFRIDTLINTDRVAWLDKPYYNYCADNEGSTTNNFRLDTMLQRWKEAHDKLKIHQDDYERYYGSYLILDEYMNTVSRPLFQLGVVVNKEEYAQIQENMVYVSEKVIESSPRLSRRQKWELLLLKRSPGKFRLYAALLRTARRCVRAVACPIRSLFWLVVRFLTKLRDFMTRH